MRGGGSNHKRLADKGAKAKMEEEKCIGGERERERESERGKKEENKSPKQEASSWPAARPSVSHFCAKNGAKLDECDC